MSHDIRTPINGICGMIDMAEHYADDMEKQTEYRTKVKEASNLLLELVNDVLFCSNLFNHNKHFLKNYAQIKWTLFQNDII